MLAVAFSTKLSDLVGAEDASYRHERQLEIADVLSSVKQLLIKYKMYNKPSESPAVSGGLQQFITNKLKKRGENEKTLTQRLRALYLREDNVQLIVGKAEGEEMAMFDCLPVCDCFCPLVLFFLFYVAAFVLWFHLSLITLLILSSSVNFFG